MQSIAWSTPMATLSELPPKQRRRAADKTSFGAPLWMWKTLGSVLIGLLSTVTYDIVGYVHWIGEEVKVHDQKFIAADARWVERKEARDRDIQDLKDRENLLQSQLNQLHDDMRTLSGHK